MTCAEFEILLCDYLDGTLDDAQKQALELHRDQCTACAELAADVNGAIGFIGRVEEVAVPPELLTKIAFEIPTGKQRREGLGSSIAKFFQPVLQPKFAMGMAMTILSFSLLGRFAGIEVRQLKASDLTPAAIWMAADDRFHKSWERAVKYYEGLKVVYQVQSRLRELTEQDEDRGQTGAQAQPGAPKPATQQNQGKGNK
jgi:hypothetical protein